MKAPMVFMGVMLVMMMGNAFDARGEPDVPDPPAAVNSAALLSKKLLAPTCKLLDFSCGRAVGREYENLGDELRFKKSELTRVLFATVARHIGLRGFAYYIKPGAKPIPLPFQKNEMSPLTFEFRANMSPKEMMGNMMITLTWSF